MRHKKLKTRFHDRWGFECMDNPESGNMQWECEACLIIDDVMTAKKTEEVAHDPLAS